MVMPTYSNYRFFADTLLLHSYDFIYFWITWEIFFFFFWTLQRKVFETIVPARAPLATFICRGGSQPASRVAQENPGEYFFKRKKTIATRKETKLSQGYNQSTKRQKTSLFFFFCTLDTRARLVYTRKQQQEKTAPR